MIRLIQGDCIEEMQKLIDDGIKVDMVLTDLPYGITNCKWDSVIPFEPMWDKLNQLTNDNTPCLFFGSEPFSSHLRLSNLKNYRYDWVLNKTRGSNFLNANRMPLSCHELISVFYRKLPYYNPQKRYVEVKHSKFRRKEITPNIYGRVKTHHDYIDDGYRFPLSIIECNISESEVNNTSRVHPTQKPVKLLEYLIKTYTKEKYTVLDFTMGSGTTGVACQNLNRSFIGIELDTEYYEIAKKRINEAKAQRRLI